MEEPIYHYSSTFNNAVQLINFAVGNNNETRIENKAGVVKLQPVIATTSINTDNNSSHSNLLLSGIDQLEINYARLKDIIFPGLLAKGYKYIYGIIIEESATKTRWIKPSWLNH